MGVIIFLALIFLLLAILVQSPIAIAYSVLYITEFALILMAAFFLGVCVWLIFFKRAHGALSRFDKEKSFEHAVYTVGKEEYHNLFPAEQMMKKRIYNKSDYFLLTLKTKKTNISFDPHSILIVVLGLILSVALTCAFVVSIPSMI